MHICDEVGPLRDKGNAAIISNFLPQSVFSSLLSKLQCLADAGVCCLLESILIKISPPPRREGYVIRKTSQMSKL